MDRIALICYARLDSTRLPRKMLEKIGNKTLAEISFTKLRDFSKALDVHSLAAVGDPELIKIAKDVGVEVFHRSEESLNSDKWKIRYKGWPERLKPRFDYTISFNACMPFITLDKTARCVETLRRNKRQMLPVSENTRAVYSADNERLLYNDKWDKADPYYTSISTFLTLRVESHIDPNLFWNDFDLLIDDAGDEAFLDINTQRDLDFCKTFYKGLFAEGENDF